LGRLDREPPFHDEDVDLTELAVDAIRSAAPHGDGRRLHLTALNGDDEPAPARTHGDARRLHQVIANLLTNALRHTRPGTQVEVRVGTTLVGVETGGADAPGRFSPLLPLPSGSPACVVEVADHGPGLSAEDATRVFERFYRVDTSRSRDRGGSGLGLAIAVTIARGHGGRLEVDTGPAQGAVFRLVLPHQP
jgi:two-component system OmpR family sensor kinase